MSSGSDVSWLVPRSSSVNTVQVPKSEKGCGGVGVWKEGGRWGW